MKWIYIQPSTINGQQIFTKASSARRYTAEIYLNYLAISEEQESSIKAIYDNGQAVNTCFNAFDTKDQTKAAAILAANGLDIEARESLDNHWSIRWKKALKKGYQKREQELQVLYQWYVTCSIPNQANAHNFQYWWI